MRYYYDYYYYESNAYHTVYSTITYSDDDSKPRLGYIVVMIIQYN